MLSSWHLPVIPFRFWYVLLCPMEALSSCYLLGIVLQEALFKSDGPLHTSSLWFHLLWFCLFSVANTTLAFSTPNHFYTVSASAPHAGTPTMKRTFVLFSNLKFKKICVPSGRIRANYRLSVSVCVRRHSVTEAGHTLDFCVSEVMMQQCPSRPHSVASLFQSLAGNCSPNIWNRKL